MGLFGSAALLLSEFMGWPGWVLFIAWVSYNLLANSVKHALLIYLQIALGFGLGLLMQVTGAALADVIGPAGLPVAVFLYTGSLAFLTKVKGLGDQAAWLNGLIVFFGSHPPIELAAITHLLLCLGAGFVFGWLLNTIMKRVNALAAAKVELDEVL